MDTVAVAPELAVATPVRRPPRIAVGLLGPFVAGVDGRVVELPVKKTRALLAWLAIEGRTPRERLAGVLWGDLDEPTARRNLRRALHRLRAAGLGDAFVASDEQVGLAEAVEVDAHRFERLVAAGEPGASLSLVRGVFADGLDLDDAPGFADWLQAQRERHAERRREAIGRHAEALEAAGELRGAVAWRRRLCDDDPLQEAEWREVMRLHAALGERGQALAAYDAAACALRSELGLEPLPETRLLAERIRSRGDGAPDGSASDGVSPAVAVASPSLRAVPLVGRDAERQRLVASTAPLGLVCGDAGVGKSRLASEAAKAAKAASDAGAPPVVRCTELSSSTPFYAVADALRDPAARLALAALPPAWRRDLALLLPELAADDAPAGDAAAADGRDQRARLLEAAARALAAVAGPGGVVVVDDLQWADASTIELVAHLARRRAQAPEAMPRVVATARTPELDDHGFAATAIAGLAREGLVDRLDLAPFDDWQMLQLVHALSRREGGVRFAARLAAATSGNVFFALETIRALLESGELHVDADRGWSTRFDESTTAYAELPLPPSVVDAVRSRVARIGAAATRLLETASLAEPGSGLAELRAASALSDFEALDAIERAIHARVLERAGDGYRIAHDLIGHAVRTGLSPERRRLIHGRLAAALEPLGAPPARVAAHWQAAGERGRAAAAWERAGEAACTLNAHREAAADFERAADLTADDERAAALYQRAVQRILMISVSGEHAALARLLGCLKARASPHARFAMLVNGGQIASHNGRHADALRLAREALDASLPGDPALRLHALSIAAYSESVLGRLDEGYASYLEALASRAPAASPEACR